MGSGRVPDDCAKRDNCPRRAGHDCSLPVQGDDCNPVKFHELFRLNFHRAGPEIRKGMAGAKVDQGKILKGKIETSK